MKQGYPSNTKHDVLTIPLYGMARSNNPACISACNMLRSCKFQYAQNRIDTILSSVIMENWNASLP